MEESSTGRPSEALKLTARYHFTHVSGGRLGHAGSLLAELFPENRWSPYAVLGYGSEAFAPSTVQGARTHARSTTSAAPMQVPFRKLTTTLTWSRDRPD